jgi:CubicO group peptidase (beta-lactamase class C family)
MAQRSGLSQARLGRMDEAMRGYVERGEVAGVVTLLCRHGEVHVEAYGAMDVASAAPMRRDSIFRISSMTKPITAAAAMILVEEAKLRLDEPVDRLLPELADRKVLRAIDAPLDDTVPAHRPITLRDLLTFRLGFGIVMDFSVRYPIQQAMSDAGIVIGPKSDSPHGPDEWIKRFGQLPLMHQPGERWMYHSGSDVLGVLVARAAGMRLEEFLAERILGPLGMKDTAFSVPEAKLSRLTTAYGADPATGKLTVYDEARSGRWASPAMFPSGGAGLVSTADDFLAFGQMMLDRGRHGTDRILARPTVEVMTTDQLTPEQKSVSPFFPGFWDSRGWGFGVSVVTRRDSVAAVPGRFGWDGGLGTSWYSDPREDMVGVLLTQRLMSGPSGDNIHADFWTLAYQAIDD